MEPFVAVLIILIALIIVIYLFINKQEEFCAAIEQRNNAEFRGMNMFLNENGTFPGRSVEDCIDVCVKNKDCKGYSFYIPGQKCYIFSSGGFVDERPGYISGRKV